MADEKEAILQKMSRGQLIGITSICLSIAFGVICMVGLDAKKKVEAAVTNSSEAMSLGESNKKDIGYLREKIDGVSTEQKSFSEKYDRNQEENQKVFRRILEAVKK